MATKDTNEPNYDLARQEKWQKYMYAKFRSTNGKRFFSIDLWRFYRFPCQPSPEKFSGSGPGRIFEQSRPGPDPKARDFED